MCRFKVSWILTVLFSILSIIPAECKTGETLRYPFFQRGMCYASWEKNSYSGYSSEKSLESMAKSGVTCVSIVTTWYQEKADSTYIYKTEKTPSNASIRHAIRTAKKLGMAVMLKPHIDLLDQRSSNWRADIGFQSEEDWEKWFNNYSKFINNYAKLAEEEGAEFLCIGTELSFATTKASYWRDLIIPGVRQNFSGQITYAANWDNYKNVEFWDMLDYAGIDAYFPLAYGENPSYEDIKEGWRKWAGEIEAWQAEINKPVIFTEVGYCSADTAASNPWEVAMSGNPNLKIQADCYRAVFETFWDKEWFWGAYWWAWNTSSISGGSDNRRFTPQNKPAGEELAMWYKKLNDKDMPDTATLSGTIPPAAFKEIKTVEKMAPLDLSLQPNLPMTNHLAVKPLAERIKKGNKETGGAPNSEVY